MKLLPRITAAPLAALAALAAPWVIGWEAHAATLHVNVVGADGRPAADAVVMVQPPAGSAAAPPAPASLVVDQKVFRFMPYVAVVAPGGAVRFVNKDSFDHHIRSLPGGPLSNVAPVRSVEFRLAAAGRSGDASELVTLELPGSILLGCHLHGSMRGHVLVAGSPWFAVTDERGRARIEGLPEGTLQMRLWHPDQLVEQPAATLQLGPSLGTEAKLNFTPRRRPPPRPADPSYGPPGSN